MGQSWRIFNASVKLGGWMIKKMKELVGLRTGLGHDPKIDHHFVDWIYSGEVTNWGHKK